MTNSKTSAHHNFIGFRSFTESSRTRERPWEERKGESETSNNRRFFAGLPSSFFRFVLFPVRDSVSQKREGVSIQIELTGELDAWDTSCSEISQMSPGPRVDRLIPSIGMAATMLSRHGPIPKQISDRAVTVNGPSRTGSGQRGKTNSFRGTPSDDSVEASPSILTTIEGWGSVARRDALPTCSDQSMERLIESPRASTMLSPPGRWPRF